MGSQQRDDQIANNDTVYNLDAENRSISQPIDPQLTEPEKYKFMEIEVTKVTNPQKHPLIFEVYYQVDNREKMLLGSFSLFPPDNPGKFIVATQGKLTREGNLILSLVSPEEIVAGDKLQVTVKKINFKKD